jgi:two-component system LytT family response regulator
MDQTRNASGPLRAILVDDESLARASVRAALAGRPDLAIVGECADGAAAVASIRDLKPDVVFLDIQMPGMTGFDVIEEIGADRMPPVVFITAHDVHALRAFKVHALDFVLKPFDDERLSEAVDEVHRQVRLRRDGELGRRFAALLNEVGHPAGRGLEATAEASVPQPTAPLSRLTVRVDGNLHLIPVGEIDWIEGAGNYVNIHAGKRSLPLRSTLVTLASRLPHERFVRIHRSTIVNVERIREVQAWFGGDYIALLHGGEKLRVSRSYASDLLGQLR